METLFTTCSLLVSCLAYLQPWSERWCSITKCTAWHYITAVTAVKTSLKRVYFVPLSSSHIYDLDQHVMPIAFLWHKLVFHLKVTWLQGHVMDHLTLLLTGHWSHPAQTWVLNFFIVVIFHVIMEYITHTGFFNVKKYVKQSSNTPTDNQELTVISWQSSDVHLPCNSNSYTLYNVWSTTSWCQSVSAVAPQQCFHVIQHTCSSLTRLSMPLALMRVALNGCFRWTTVPLVSTIGFFL